MNKWIGSGRLTENPVIRYNGDKVSFVTFTVMCKRNKRIREGDQPVDFIDCICFGNIARLARDYLYKDKKVEIIGPLQSGHYETKDGKKVYTKTVLVEELQFAETKAEEKERQENKNQEPPEPAPPDYKFMDIPDGVDQELPFR